MQSQVANVLVKGDSGGRFVFQVLKFFLTLLVWTSQWIPLGHSFSPVNELTWPISLLFQVTGGNEIVCWKCYFYGLGTVIPVLGAIAESLVQKERRNFCHLDSHENLCSSGSVPVWNTSRDFSKWCPNCPRPSLTFPGILWAWDPGNWSSKAGPTAFWSLPWPVR